MGASDQGQEDQGPGHSTEHGNLKCVLRLPRGSAKQQQAKRLSK